MSAKMLTFFLFMLLVTGILIGILAGGGGVTTTYLTASVNATDTVIPVETTRDFLDEDCIIIQSEKIYYTAKNDTAFLSCTRGYGGTTAAAHPLGEPGYRTKVYTQRASAINNALGFNIVAVQDSLGWATFLAIPFLFVTVTIPNIFRMSTNLLTGDLAIISWIFYVMSAAFVISLAWSIISARRTA